MLHPGAVPAHRHAGARVDARDQRNQRDAIFHRADDDAEIAADAFGVDHLEMALAVLLARDRLVRGVLAGDMAAPAFDAEPTVSRSESGRRRAPTAMSAAG
jgi:hypothetical protein